MKKIFVFLFLIVATSGCANFNPRNDQRINNNGKIDDIRSNQNGVMAEIGKLRQQSDIQNSRLKEVQQGVFNMNAALSRNENSGIQILQGDGALVTIFGLGVVGMLLYWYRDRAIKGEKSCNIMAKEIARYNDPQLNDNVLRAAMYTETEAHVYHLLSKNQKELFDVATKNIPEQA